MSSRTRARDASERLAKLLPSFERGAEVHDATDRFVSKNYRALKQSRLMSIAVPAELGGDGLTLPELSRLVQTLATACASTALSFSMHLQSVASLAWHWRHHKAPVTSILRRVAREQLAIATTNGSDWLNGSGEAVPVRHGFQVTAVKRTVSAARGSELLATNAVVKDAFGGATVLHFIISTNAKGVTIERSWKATGMRGTGSDNVHLSTLFVTDRAVIARRPVGRWHPLYHTAVMIALPLIMSVYVGVAEQARDVALAVAKRKTLTDAVINQAGTVENYLNTARMALQDMLQANTDEPDIKSTIRILMSRSVAGEAARAAVEAAIQMAGASAFMRTSPLERMFRDVQAARFHPVDANVQRHLAGRVALGLDLESA